MEALTFDYQDTLEPLNTNVPLPERIRAIHDAVNGRLGGIDRIAAALFDPKTDLVGLIVWPWANAPPGARAVHTVTTATTNRCCAPMSSFLSILSSAVQRQSSVAEGTLQVSGTCDNVRVTPSRAL